MKYNILISTMNCENPQMLLKKMNIKDNFILINQITNNTQNINIENETNKILSFYEKGLSKSRNKAIANTCPNTEICIIADDDMYYEKKFYSTIEAAYKKYKDADIIAFVVDNEEKEKRKKILKEGKISYLKSMKLQSVQITFKRNSIIEKNIKFDELYGAGSKYNWGEENIFLFDCLRKKLKIYYVPFKIATLYKNSTSSWDRKNNVEHYEKQGVIYRRMSKLFYPILITQFVIRKRNLYSKDLSSFMVYKSMFNGIKKYKKNKFIYWVGDTLNNTGPAIVNKEYQKNIQEYADFCKTNNKIYRILHFAKNIFNKKAIVISGFSNLNYYILKFSNIFNKKTIYLMHGWIKIESKYTKRNSKDIIIENKILKEAKQIITVSEFFAKELIKAYPEYKNKITYNSNGTNIEKIYKRKTKKNKEKYHIITVGGGVKQKNTLTLCKAIEKINNKNIKFIVIGKIAEDGEKIKKYSFVEYYEKISHEKVIELMQQSDLYIQNSYFETFGLSIIEALESKCNILISKNVGVIDILDNIKESDIITDNESINEISKKIKDKMKETKINITIKNNTTWEECSTKLLNIIRK